MTRKEVAIEVKGVDFVYDKGKPQEVHALRKVNIEVKEGEYVAFFGPSGCGKSTLLYMLAGIEKPTEGEIYVNGKEITRLEAKDLALYRQTEIGIIFQSFNLIPSIKVIDNVAMPMAFVGVQEAERKKRAQDVLDRLNMGKFSYRYPHELSGGQQQRVSIARALINSPPVILADEPLGNLDSENANRVLEFLKELNTRDKKTIVMVTHEAWSLRDATKIFHMKDGGVFKVEERTPKENTGTFEGHEYETAPLEIKAKALAHMFLRGFPRVEVERMENIITNFFSGEIDLDTLIATLDKPFKDGGVGLWKQRAERIGKMLQRELEEEKNLSKIYEKLNKNPEMPLCEEIESIKNWLMEGLNIELNPLQDEQLTEAIEDRIRGIIGAEDFVRVLDIPKKNGGMGLSIQTSLKFSEKIESLIGEEFKKTKNE